MRYVKQLPQFPKRHLPAVFPNMSPLALDLLEKMLVFDPDQRITGHSTTSFRLSVYFRPCFSCYSANFVADLECYINAVDEALCHPYLSVYHEINAEPICSMPFSYDFEESSITEENVKELIWRESLQFNPFPLH